MRPLRIVAYTDSAEMGGAERALSHLLAGLDDAFDVTVAGVSEPVISSVASGRAISLMPAPRATLPDTRAFRAHLRALRAVRPDVLHANLISPFSCQYALAAAIVLRVPSVAVYQLPNTPVNLRQQLLKRLTARWTTAHVGVGKRTAREVETVVGLRHGRVRTIYNGVPDVAAPPAVEARDGAPTIGAVGRLAPQKGFDLLLRALVDVPAARAVIVGRGDEHPRLEALARDLGVAERTSLLGWVDDPRALLSSFDVFALPSRFEGFPLSVLEAQLAELPVVAANVGSVGEAVLPGATGLLVEPEDPRALAAALNTLLADAAERHRLGRAGRQLVLERFTAAHMTRAFERLYVELTG